MSESISIWHFTILDINGLKKLCNFRGYLRVCYLEKMLVNELVVQRHIDTGFLLLILNVDSILVMVY